jgi:hypothetical protein
VVERRRAVALASHFREAEGLSIAQIADRLGRSPATIKAYFYDLTGAKARAVKRRYERVCRGCGSYTQPVTARATPTRTPRPAIPARSGCARPASACWQRGARRTGSWLVDLHFRYANPSATADLDVGLALAGRPFHKPSAGCAAYPRCSRSRRTAISSSYPIEQTPTSRCISSSTPTTDARAIPAALPSPARAAVLARANAALSELVQRGNADTDEVRARNARESRRTDSTAVGGCCSAIGAPRDWSRCR